MRPNPGDSDGDGGSNASDNCIAVFNPDQSDTNSDGMGNACTQDFAILKITAPIAVMLTALKPSQTKTIIVQIHNQGPQTETIADAAALANLLTLRVEALSGTLHVCDNLTPNLNPIGPRFPLTMSPLKKVTVRFQVLYRVTPASRTDPNPDGTLKDKGCGKKKTDKTFGTPVLIDVVNKR